MGFELLSKYNQKLLKTLGGSCIIWFDIINDHYDHSSCSMETDYNGTEKQQRRNKKKSSRPLYITRMWRRNKEILNEAVVERKGEAWEVFWSRVNQTFDSLIDPMGAGGQRRKGENPRRHKVWFKSSHQHFCINGLKLQFRPVSSNLNDTVLEDNSPQVSHISVHSMSTN